MNYDNVSVLSVAHVDAPHRITSEEIEAQLAPTMERLGVPGTVRASFSLYNSEEDVDHFVIALRKALTFI